MNQYHYLWPLFVPDQTNAQNALRKLWEDNKIDTIQAAHWALNIGDEKWVKELISKDKLNLTNKNLGIQFRLYRKTREANPYQKAICLDSEKAKESRETARKGWISLHGGIGDHIEDISILVPWLRKNNISPRIMCSAERIKQLTGIMQNIQLNVFTNEINCINSKVLMASLESELPRPEAFMKENVVMNDKQSVLFCCWKATGKGDKLSKWIRSIPFEVVWQFYEKVIESGIKSSEITDCSKWKYWEEKKLVSKGIKIYRPEKEGVIQFAQEVANSEFVVSIDTALVHISTAINKECELLLPVYNDERWYQLMQDGSSYKKNCNITKQEKYGEWDGVLSKVENKIQKRLDTERFTNTQLQIRNAI